MVEAAAAAAKSLQTQATWWQQEPLPCVLLWGFFYKDQANL